MRKQEDIWSSIGVGLVAAVIVGVVTKSEAVAFIAWIAVGTVALGVLDKKEQGK